MRPLLIVLVFLTALLAVGCKKPRERPKIDPHLEAALLLAETDPEKALGELALAKGASPAQHAYLSGRALEAKGQLKEALEAYKKATELDPSGLKPQVAVARLLLLRKDTTGAREYLVRVLLQDPDDLSAALLLAVAAESAAQRNQARLALDAWGKGKDAQGDVPPRAEYFYALASVSEDPEGIAEARKNAGIAQIGSEGAAIAYTELAVHLNQRVVATDLVRRLSRAGLKPDEHIRVARAALRLGDLAAVREALDRVPKHVRTFPLLEVKARYELASGHLERALSHAEAATKAVDPKDRVARDEVEALRAKILFALGQTAEAQKALESILKRSSAHRESHFLLAQVELRTGQIESAHERLCGMSDKYPEENDLRLKCATVTLQAGKFDQAYALFKVLYERHPNDLIALRGMSEAKRRAGKEDEALLLWQAARSGQPQNLDFLRELSGQLLRMKRPEEAISAVIQSEIQKSDPVGLNLLLADLFETLGRREDVTRTLSELVKESPKSARAWSALARDQGNNQNLQGMEQSLRTVLSLQPSALKDKARLATVLQKQKKSEEAARLFSELADATGTDVVALNNTAMLYVDELGEPERAVSFAERAHKLAPESVQVADTLAWALSHSKKKEDWERAHLLLRKFRAAEGSPEVRYHLGYVLLKLGQKEEGVAVLREVLATPGDEAWRQAAQDLIR